MTEQVTLVMIQSQSQEGLSKTKEGVKFSENGGFQHDQLQCSFQRLTFSLCLQKLPLPWMIICL
jgi:hypothetical protein